jgi:acyl-homoserine-lactone acylase
MKKILLLLVCSIGAFAQINTSEIQIARDKWGVPHIFAKTDAQVAYGLAWAHAEDDFETIQLTVLAGKGMLGQYKGKAGAPIDYVVGLLRTKETAKQHLNDLSPDFRKVVEGYVAGLNAYALAHPKEVFIKKAFPANVEDYLSSVVLSLAVLSGADGEIQKIFNGKIGEPQLPKGSNAFAFSSSKTTDGATYLNINSHQPLEGPVAWYEAHLVSEEGWNMLGGLFPGGCTVFHGTNENLGWAHTVNHQDKIDVYKLTMKDATSNEYKFDGKWETLEVRNVPLKVKMGFLKIPIKKKAYWSKYGATIKTDKGIYAIRMGANQDVRGIEQWYRMNKARNFSEFYKAMEMVAIPGFNTIYADNADTIFYVSNGKIPLRNPNYEWLGVLPGDTSATLWTGFHSFKDLPQYVNPSSGYLYNTNNTVYKASAEKDNLNPKDFDPTMGYEMTDNNRSMRFKELVDGYGKVSFDDFKKMKYDGQYPAKFYFPVDFNVLTRINAQNYPDVKAEIEKLQNWDRKSDIANKGAAMFSAFAYKLNDKYGSTPQVLTESQVVEIVAEAKAELLKNFKTTDLTLGEVQKLVRGDKALALPGLPDVLAAMYTMPYKNGVRKGAAGESYIQLVKFRKGKMPEIESVINYGASNRKGSPHYDDQMELFLNQKTKKMTLDKGEIIKNAERVYSPK